MAIGVLALQGSFHEHIAGNYTSSEHGFPGSIYSLFAMCRHQLLYPCPAYCNFAALRKIGVEAVEVRKPEQLVGLAGLIIPGGESTTMAKLAEAYNLVSVYNRR